MIIILTIRDINFMLGTKLGPYWLICWGFLCPVLLPLLLIYVLVTQVIIIVVIPTIVVRIFALSSNLGPQPLKVSAKTCRKVRKHRSYSSYVAATSQLSRFKLEKAFGILSFLPLSPF